MRAHKAVDLNDEPPSARLRQAKNKIAPSLPHESACAFELGRRWTLRQRVNVETAEQLDFLIAEGCSEIQGYMLDRPDAISWRRSSQVALQASMRSMCCVPH